MSYPRLKWKLEFIMQKNISTSLSILSILGLSLCLSSPCRAEDEELTSVPSLPTYSPIPLTEPNGKKTVDLVTRTTMHLTDDFGKVSHGMFCNGSGPLRLSSFAPLATMFERVAFNTLKKAGYHRFEKSDSAFGGQESSSADLKLGATIKRFYEQSCRVGSDGQGGVYVKVFWELFSASQQKVVYSGTTEGSFLTTASTKLMAMEENAISSAVNNLLASQEFFAAFSNDRPAAVSSERNETLTLIDSSPAKGGVAKNIASLLKAVVTIESNGASGSGFFIDNSAYILTNRHVVQNERFVRVRLSNGATMAGEVLRTDAARDVALVKTDLVNFAPMALRLTPSLMAEEVYALGSPRGKDYSGTLTKGILSAARKMDNQTYLQSDVAVTRGNSGGPLLDASGAVIGIVAKGIEGTALNLFIPIGDALKKLSIEVR